MTSEQQTQWIEGELQKRGYAEEPFPYTDGIVARTGEGVEGFRDWLAGVATREATPA